MLFTRPVLEGPEPAFNRWGPKLCKDQGEVTIKGKFYQMTLALATRFRV